MAGILSKKRTRGGGIIKNLGEGRTIGGLRDFSFNKTDINSSEGLYNLAIQSGLQKEADKIMRETEGEKVKEIFSGGFISDIFDVFNTLSYGIVGLLKGKGFKAGIISRESFSDKDALGQYGFPGVVAGIVADIALDPLTYIAPLTIAKKVPFISRAFKAGKEAIFGRKVERTIESLAPELAGRTVEMLEGGTKIGRYLAEKLSWGFGADPKFLETWRRSNSAIGRAVEEIMNMMKGIVEIEPKFARKILSKDKVGRFIRRPLEELEKELNPEDFEKVRRFYQKIDELGQEAVDLKLLSKEKYEENIGEYIKNAYFEYEKGKRKGFLGFMKVGVKGIKERRSQEELASGFLKTLTKEEITKEFPRVLTPEGKISLKNLTSAEIDDLASRYLVKLGQIENPAYLLTKSALDLTRDIHYARLFKEINERWATDVAQEGFEQLPTGKRLFTPAVGEKIQLYQKLKNLNQQLKSPLKSLKQTFKADRKTLSEIHNLERELFNLGKIREDEFYKFFQAEEFARAKGIRSEVKPEVKLAIPKELEPLAEEARKYDNAEEFVRDVLRARLISREKLAENIKLSSPDSWPSLELKDALIKAEKAKAPSVNLTDFYNQVVKGVEKITPTKVSESVAKGNIKRLIQVQSQIEKLSSKVKELKEIDKRSIDDSYRFLENIINKIGMEKEEIFEQIGKVKLGELAGKYVPKPIKDMIQEMTEPYAENFGNRLMANFKYAKVILNPLTHIRNRLGNQLLKWYNADMNPLDPRVIDANLIANKEALLNKGEFIDAARKSGNYNLDTFASRELNSILDHPESLKAMSGLGRARDKIVRKLSNIYQLGENSDKLSVFIFYKKYKGFSDEDAWLKAEESLFNYSEVTAFIRRLRTAIWGVPFITFTLKATPIIAKTAVRAPQRIGVIGKIKNAIERQADIKITERERASEPPWIKNGFYIKLPMKDKYGRSAYFDLTYILPFGDLISGKYFERPIKRETGLPEGVAPTILGKSPFLNLVKELSRNADFYGNKIWKESDSLEKQLGDITRHIAKTMLPPFLGEQLPEGYDYKGERVSRGFRKIPKTEEEIKQRRDLMQEIFRHLGMKIQPIQVDIQENYQEFNRSRALKQLLLENGILSKFEITY